jgi:uncharacterized damage-inducible protein DinB
VDRAYFEELFQYSHWANGRARAAAAVLGPDDFTRDLKNSFPSVRDTLVHIYDAEWTWLERWNGRSPGALPPGAPFATLAALEARWTAVEGEQAEFVARLTGDALDRSLNYINRKGEPRSFPLWRQMLHVVNHSTYHRGQITTMLRQLGAKPATTDLVVFYDQTGVRPSGRTS